MKAALCKRLDGPEGIEIEDIPAPAAGRGEAVVAVKAAALNFFDTLITRGKYQTKPELPFSPAGEIAGVVTAVGDGVADLAVGDRVMAYVGFGGAREQIAVPAGGVASSLTAPSSTRPSCRRASTPPPSRAARKGASSSRAPFRKVRARPLRPQV